MKHPQINIAKLTTKTVPVLENHVQTLQLGTDAYNTAEHGVAQTSSQQIHI